MMKPYLSSEASCLSEASHGEPKARPRVNWKKAKPEGRRAAKLRASR